MTSYGSFKPYCFACCLHSSVGTKHSVVLLSNHVLWHVVKSVTTVAKCVGGICPLRTRFWMYEMGSYTSIG